MTLAPPHPFMVDAALDLAARGLAVFPLPVWGRVPARGWQAVATTDPAAIRALFADGGNIGVACRASGVVVLDLDRHDDEPDGIVGWKALCVSHGQAPPETFTVVTGRRGLHLYFRVPAGAVITSSSGPRAELPPGIDVRAPGRRTGGYVLGPGAQVEAGRYRIACDVPVAPLPRWLHQVLVPACPRVADERRILLAAPLPYAVLLGTVQCLSLAGDTRGEAATLRARLWPYMQAAGVAEPQEARVPCDVLRAATHCLRKWRATTGTALWDDTDDAELTTAWREGLNASRPR